MVFVFFTAMVDFTILLFINAAIFWNLWRAASEFKQRNHDLERIKEF
jgi:hypothetical protein